MQLGRFVLGVLDLAVAFGSAMEPKFRSRPKCSIYCLAHRPTFLAKIGLEAPNSFRTKNHQSVGLTLSNLFNLAPKPAVAGEQK